MSRILHISDLHFWHIPRNPLQWISKRATTYLGILLQTKRKFKEARMKQLLKSIDSLNVSAVVISGDLTSSGTDEEFEMFDLFFQELKKHVEHICLVPGNHDVYIERDRSKGFYKHAAKWLPENVVDSLFEKRQASLVMGHIEYILLDLCQPRPFFHAEGIFSEEQAQTLSETLKEKHLSKERLVVGHYPMHPTQSPSQELIGYKKLENTFRADHSVRAYLHGHTHQQHIIDERFFGLPVSIESGSLSACDKAGFALLEMHPSSSRIYLYRFDPLHNWQVHQELLWKVDQEDGAIGDNFFKNNVIL